MQLNIGHLDENGVYNGSFSTLALHGQVRAKVIRGGATSFARLLAKGGTG